MIWTRGNRRAPLLALALAHALAPVLFAQASLGEGYGPGDAPARYEVLRVAVDPAMPPLQFVDESGLPAGFLVDAMLAIGEANGMALALLPMSRESSLAALSSGAVDAILGAPYSALSSAAPATLAMTEPLFASAVSVVSSADDERYADGVARLADGVLALTSGSPAYDFLKGIRAVRFNETERPDEALELLALGRADAFLEDRAVADYLLASRPDARRFKTASTYWLPVEYGIGIRPTDQYLLYVLNQGIGAIKESGAYSAARERWFGDSERSALRRLRNALAAFAVSMGVIIVGGGASLWWNRLLAGRVRAGTAELRNANEELKRLYGEAEDKKEFVAQILESSPRGLVTCDASGLVTMCNARARAIAGLEPDPVGRPYGDYPFLATFLPPERFRRALEGESFPFESVEWRRAGGGRLHIRNGIYPMLDHEGAIRGLILSFEDHTAEKAMLARLAEREKDEALGRIVAGVAHEIRNPLTSIKTFVELLPRKMADPRFLSEMGAYVPREVERMDKLIRDLIDFSRPRTPMRQAVDLGALAGSCLALAAPSLAKRGVTTAASVQAGLLVSADPDQLRQCAMNFILNAADSVEERRAREGDLAREGRPGVPVGGGEPDLLLAVRVEGGEAVLEFRDRGGGLSPEAAARAFEPFYTTKPGGVGLGLPLSKQYIEENGGRLELESEPGRGATVRAYLPLGGRNDG